MPHSNGSSAREPFGRVAIRKGFVSEHQVSQALALQKGLPAQGLPHKLIGMIMLEMGALGTTELIDVLRDMNAPVSPAADPRTAP
jgi:hypothetical protein